MSLSDRQSTSAHLIALDVRLGVDAALPVPEVERAVHLDDRLRLGAVVAQVALERGVLRVDLSKIFSCNNTVWGSRSRKRFCNMFSESSTGSWAELQLPCCPRGTSRKHVTKHFTQPAAPDCMTFRKYSFYRAPRIT